MFVASLTNPGDCCAAIPNILRCISRRLDDSGPPASVCISARLPWNTRIRWCGSGWDHTRNTIGWWERSDLTGTVFPDKWWYRFAMRATAGTTSIYLVCFHSEKPKDLTGSSGQYCKVDSAVLQDEWPYDNGDDPSFYVARQGGRLTWGVCRQDLRDAIARGSIVVFFSFTPLVNDKTLYRLCAVATVDDKVDHRAIHRDRRLYPFRRLYINGLIVPEAGGWRYDETDRPAALRHKDWLWRMAYHRGIAQAKFNKKYSKIRDEGYFPDSAAGSAGLQFAGNYIVFAKTPDRSFISSYPQEVAIAHKGRHERWSDPKLREMTVLKAASLGARDYLRTINESGRNLHRQIRFEMPTEEATGWRDDLISVLKKLDGSGKKRTVRQVRTSGTAKCH